MSLGFFLLYRLSFLLLTQPNILTTNFYYCFADYDSCLHHCCLNLLLGCTMFWNCSSILIEPNHETYFESLDFFSFFFKWKDLKIRQRYLLTIHPSFITVASIQWQIIPSDNHMNRAGIYQCIIYDVCGWLN